MPEKITWFELMWNNFYIQLFAIAVIMLVGLIIDYKRTQYVPKGWFFVALSIPIMMIIGIAYFGFYKFWLDIH